MQKHLLVLQFISWLFFERLIYDKRLKYFAVFVFLKGNFMKNSKFRSISHYREWYQKKAHKILNKIKKFPLWASLGLFQKFWIYTKI